jgi:Hemerythrin HHE cation binding domain
VLRHRRIDGDASANRGAVMADDKTKRGSPDNKRLNKSEPYEVAYAKSKRAKAGAKKTAKTATKTAKKAGKKATTRSASSRAAPAAGSRTRKAASRSKSSSRPSSTSRAKSASPAMKRTNAAPAAKKSRTTTRATPNPPKAEKTAENTAPKTMREADAVDLLTDDHLEVGALFKQYEKIAKKEAPAEQRRTLAQSICDMLKAHTTIEEEIFYPAARRAGVDADLLDEADIEHASAKELIAQIEGGNPDDDHYDAKVKVLGEYITHHVVEEHTEMFVKCRRSGMDLVGLRGEMEARKMSLVPEGSDEASEAANDGKGKSTGILASLFSKT